MGLRRFLICSVLLARVHYSYTAGLGMTFSHSGASVLILPILFRKGIYSKNNRTKNDCFLEDIT